MSTTEVLPSSTAAFEVEKESLDLREKLGIEDDEGLMIQVYARDPHKKFGRGKYIARFPISVLDDPYPEISKLGPGSYTLRIHDGKRFKPGSQDIEIDEHAAREAGWLPREEKKYSESLRSFDFAEKQMDMLRRQYEAEREEKNLILANALQAISKGTTDEASPVLASIQTQQQSFQQMMVQMQQQHQDTMKMMMTMMDGFSKAQQASTQTLVQIMTQKHGPDVVEIMSLLTPLLQKEDSATKLATSLVSMFRNGLETAQLAERPEQPIWQSVLQAAAPGIASGLFGKMDIGNALGIKQTAEPAGQLPQEAPSTSAPNPRPEPNLSNTEKQKGNGRLDKQDEMVVLLQRCREGEPAAIKQVFVWTLHSTMAMTSDMDTIYRIVTDSLPKIVHEQIPEVKVDFSAEDGVHPEISRAIWAAICKEYEENEPVVQQEAKEPVNEDKPKNP